jgi:hypothetical protein
MNLDSTPGRRLGSHLVDLGYRWAALAFWSLLKCDRSRGVDT